MGFAKLKTKISVDDYLKGELSSQIRYEYIHGEVYAMAGTSQNHNRITGNLFSSLASRISRDGCEVYTESIKVQPSDDVLYYPDILVTCEGEFRNKYICEQPILLVEVTSPSTAKIDRREKLIAYRNMPSVREILIIDQEKIWIELHRRDSVSDWNTYSFDDADSEIELKTVDLAIKVSEIYRRVTFGTLTIVEDEA